MARSLASLSDSTFCERNKKKRSMISSIIIIIIILVYIINPSHPLYKRD